MAYRIPPKDRRITNQEIASIAYLIYKSCSESQRFDRIRSFLSTCLSVTDLQRVGDSSYDAANKLITSFDRNQYHVVIHEYKGLDLPF